MRFSHVIFCTVALLFAAVSSAGCDFLEDNADITKEVEIPVSFTIDGDELCRRAEADVDCENPPSETAQQSFELGALEIDQDIDIVERTGRPELDDLAGRFKEITVTGVDYEFPANSLTFTTPRIDFNIGPIEATSTSGEFADEVVRIATIPPVEPGATPDETATVRQSAQSAASDLFRQLEFSALPAGRPTIEEGDELPPQGRAEVDAVVDVKFVANPVDAVN